LPELPGLDELPELPALDLDTEDPRAGSLAQAAASLATAWRGGAQEVYGCKPAELDQLVKGVTADAAAGAPPPRAEFSADALAQRAGFGDAPDGRLAAIGYALRVWRQRRVLRVAAQEAERAAEQARTQGRAALAELGEAIFSRRAEAGRGSLAPRIEAVVKALAMLEERERAQVELGDEAALEFEQHETAIAAAERAAEPHRTRCAAIEEQLARARRDGERAAALHKRTEIEIRAARSAAEPDARRIERAEADRDARAAELARAQSAVAAVEAELAAAQAELATHTAEIAAHRRALQASIEEQARKAGAAQSAIGDAAQIRRGALSELASVALLQNLAPKAAADVAVETLRGARAAADDAALATAAIDAYDADGYRTGLITAALLAGALLAVCLWLVS
jgi:hypothetical protein